MEVLGSVADLRVTCASDPCDKATPPPLSRAQLHQKYTSCHRSPTQSGRTAAVVQLPLLQVQKTIIGLAAEHCDTLHGTEGFMTGGENIG